jgi:hypothetical protein
MRRGLSWLGAFLADIVETARWARRERRRLRQARRNFWNWP